MLSIREQILTHQSGGAQAGINQEDVKNLYITHPPLQEQTQIAKYLDYQTNIIDQLIEKKEKLVSLLQEQRQAIINEAVTKGLNPNAKMKDSGIEWLGEIPERWHAVSLNKIIEVKDGTHDTPKYMDSTSDDVIPFVTSKDFKDGKINFTNVKYISRKDHNEISKRSNVEKGDIIMSMIGGNIGNLVEVSTENEFSIKNVCLFKTSHDNVIRRHLYFILKSYLLNVQIDLKSKGGAQGFLALGDLRKLVYIKAPKKEMIHIVNYLSDKEKFYNQILSLTKEQIVKLREYRQSIISEAVTGKIDLRKWNIPNKEIA